ncbi:hypothetical protein Esti_005070 [Eimeria stiedai]
MAAFFRVNKCCASASCCGGHLPFVWSSAKGILIAAFGAFLYSCTGLLTKVICEASMPILNLLLFRFIAQSVLCLCICRWRRINPLGYLNPKTSLAQLLVARGVVAVVCHALYYIALSRLPLGDAAALGLTATIWAAFLGALVQKEGLGCIKQQHQQQQQQPGLCAAASACTQAVATTTQTSVNEAGIIEDLSKGGAIIILIVGAFLHGVSFVLGRHVATRAPPILSIVLMMLFGLISFTPLVCIISPFHVSFFQALNGGQWVALAVVPFVGLGAQLCLISALEFESAGTIAILAIGEGFNAASLGGAALIVCSAIVLAFYSIRKGLRRDRLAAAAAAAAEAEEEAKAAEAGSAAAAEVGAAAAAAALAGVATDAATADPDRSSEGQVSPSKEAQLELTGRQAGDRLSPLSSSSSSHGRSSSSCCSSKSSSKNKTRSSSSRHSQRQQPAAANAAESDTDFS